MQTIVSRFSYNLKEINYPTEQQKNLEFWDIEGVLNNQLYKFYVRETIQLDNNKIAQKGSTKIKADKIVFERSKDWVILEVEELHKYVIKEKTKIIEIERLREDLELTIIIQK